MSDRSSGTAIALRAQVVFAPADQPVGDHSDGQLGVDAKSALTPEMAEAAMRRRVAGRRMMSNFGQIVAIAMHSPHSQAMPIGELKVRVAPAVASGQFMLAGKRYAKSGFVTPTTALLWAQVTPDVDARLSNVAQPGSGMLAAGEWSGGDNIWLVEAFGERALLPKMIESLGQSTWKGKTIKMRVIDASGAASIKIVRPG